MSHLHALNAPHDHAPGTFPGHSNSVKARLTPKRRSRPVENDAFAAFACRVLRAYSRRIAAGDIDALEDMAGLASEIDTAMSHAVQGLRQQGYSWAEIGTRLAITRQAAQQRWGHLA